jgi:hypothetical protein
MSESDKHVIPFPAKHLKSGVGEYTNSGWWRGFNPDSDEAREWAETVDFDEPIEVNVYNDGSVLFSDGHHRAMAGRILDRNVPVYINMNKMRPEVWDWYYDLLLKGQSPREINPESWNLNHLYDENTSTNPDDILQTMVREGVQIIFEELFERGFDEWLQSIGGIDKVIDEYNIDLGDTYYYLKDDMEDEDNEEEFEEKAQEALLSELENLYYDWQYKYSNIKFPLKLYRCIALKSLEDLDTKNLGVFWSDKIESAECHWTKGGESYIVSVLVNEDDIDENATTWHNMYPSLGETEQEINLLPGRNITIVGILGPDNEWQEVKIAATT